MTSKRARRKRKPPTPRPVAARKPVRSKSKRDRSPSDILPDAKQLLDAVISAFPGAIARIGRDWRYEYVSPAYERIFRLPASGIVGRHVRDLLGAAAFAKAEPYAREAFAGKRVSYDSVVPTPYGMMAGTMTLIPEYSAADEVTSILAIRVDRSDQARAEQALAASETQTRLLVKAANVGLWDWDLVTNAVYFSPEWKRQLGYEDGELANRFDEWERRVHPDDLAGTMQAVTQFLAGRNAEHEVEFRMRHRDGSWRWILARGDLMRDAKGTPVRMMGCHVDVTARRHVAEERARVFERISDAFVALDRDWRYTFVNEKAGQIFGRQPAELLGKHIWTEFPEGKGQRFHLAYEKAMAEQQPAFLEEYYPPYDRWFENHIYPSPEGLTIYFRDITNQKRAELALRESESRLNEAQRKARIGSWRMSADGTIKWSDQMYDLLPLPRDVPVTVAAIVACVHPDDVEDQYYSIFVNALNSGATDVTNEYRVVWPDGRVLNMLSVAEIRRDAAGQLIEVIGTVQDVTERNRSNVELQRANAELQELSHRLIDIQEAERRSLAAELHDELGQTLTAARIDLRLLEHIPDAVARQSQLTQTTASIERALQQVRSLSLELRPPMLDDFGVAAALQWLVERHARGGIKVTVTSDDPDARFNPVVETSCFRIAQEALTNVARHADARNVTVDLRVAQGTLHLRVLDDGKGFDVAAARRHAATGRSLGLLGMEERARLAGGGIEWRSTPHPGTEIHAWFPSILPPAPGMGR